MLGMLLEENGCATGKNEWDCTGGEWANARACPGGNYMHYILEKCMYVRGGMEGVGSVIKMVLD